MRSDSNGRQIDLLAVLTLVLGIGCLIVGITGHYILPAPPTAAKKDIVTRVIDLTLTDSAASAMPSVNASPVASPVPVPVLTTPLATPIDPAPAMLVPKSAPQATTPVYKQIAYGTGEGAQPKPDYPIEAQLDGQEGTVVIRFVVGLDGSVTSTQVIKASPWPLLNQAAARSIRETWTYPPGAVRHYEVSITYRRKTN